MDQEETSRRTRSPGVQYPGASIPKVIELLKVLDEAGGESSIGRLAARLEMSETSAAFKRVLISARSYGLAEWTDSDKTIFGATADGHAALEGDLVVLRRALIRPLAFRSVARKFKGRALPQEGLAEAFKVAGVAPAGSELAAANFAASIEIAQAVAIESGRRILAHDLPFDDVEVEGAEGADKKPQTANVSVTRDRPRTITAEKVSALARSGDGSFRGGGPGGKALGLGLHLDVSGWTVDQVVELVKRLREEGVY